MDVALRSWGEFHILLILFQYFCYFWLDLVTQLVRHGIVTPRGPHLKLAA